MSESENNPDNFEEEEDKELLALRELKKKLVNEVCELRDKLKEEERRHELEVYASLNGSECESVKPLNKNNSILIEVSQRTLGVSFEDVNKNWLQDDIYEYTATLITKALRMFIDLTVNLKDEENFEILNINCHFLKNEVEKCYINEIKPWIDMFTKMKNFSFLISAIANYSDQSFLRARILKKLEKNNYVTLENCMEENGGIAIFVHSSKNTDQVYLKFQWATYFLEKTWRIEHCFTIVPSVQGSRFVENNKELLKKFCRSSLRKTELEELWSQLCSSINEEDEQITS